MTQEGLAHMETRVGVLASGLRSVEAGRRGKDEAFLPLLPGAVPLKPVREWERVNGLRGSKRRAKRVGSH